MEFTDGIWRWPEGLVHYVEEHGVRLPESFVGDALMGREPTQPPSPPGNVVNNLRDWVSWAQERGACDEEIPEWVFTLGVPAPSP